MSYSMEIADSIRDSLTDDGLHFDFFEEKGIFKFGVSISGKIKRLSYLIHVRERDFIVYAISSVGADSDDDEVMSEMAEFLTRVNYNLVNGNFEMDYEDGEIRYKMCIYCGDGNVPDDSIVGICLLLSAKAFEVYSSGIVAVAFGGMDGKRAYNLCKD